MNFAGGVGSVGAPTPFPGRYEMFSQSRFRGAPAVKTWTAVMLAGSCALIPVASELEMKYFTATLNDAFDISQAWKLVLSKVFFLDTALIICGTVLVYYMRFVERRFGSRKFMSFLAISGLTATVLEVAALCWLNESSKLDHVFLASGPFALLSACFLQFLLDIPFVPYAKIAFFPLSIKNLPCLFYLQLLFWSRRSTIACLCGLTAGALYRMNVLKVQSWSLIPSWMVSICSRPANPIGWLIQRWTQWGEERKGRVLPVAATVERQRAEILDEYERRLIFAQMQQVHAMEQNNAPNDQLRYLGRLFNGALARAPLRSQAVEPPSDEAIQQLMDMGFTDRSEVVAALGRAGNDVNAAAETLVQRL
uniref:UBA domain-containing protein n=1 Tax=Plectus sambesii TaxID=2011161 RepID=A0A914WJG7_9BILA